MNVAICYQFHDHEPQMMVIDTDLLDTNNIFQLKLKIGLFDAMSGDRRYLNIDGNKCNDQFGSLSNAEIDLPDTIHHICYVHVDFEG